MSETTQEETDRIKKLIEERAEQYGYPIQAWVVDEDFNGNVFADLGNFEAADDGNFWEAGEKGTVRVYVVGSRDFGNERVVAGFLTEGTDCDEEVDLGMDVVGV